MESEKKSWGNVRTIFADSKIWPGKLKVENYWKHTFFPFNFGDFLRTPPVAASLKFWILWRKHCFSQEKKTNFFEKNNKRGIQLFGA